MTRKRRNHSPEFKAKVALDAAKGDKTVAELAQKYNLHANQISTWKKELLENAAMIFATENHSGKESSEDVDKLHAKIGMINAASPPITNSLKLHDFKNYMIHVIFQIV